MLAVYDGFFSELIRKSDYAELKGLAMAAASSFSAGLGASEVENNRFLASFYSGKNSIFKSAVLHVPAN